jgi:hypothetical protein
MTKDEALRLALEALEKLWNIIDDIDTYSDMAKADEKLYRSLVERRQRQRFEETGISTDGYELHGGAITAIKAALEAKDEPEQMAKLGWQVIDCPICGGGARAFPKQEAKDEPWEKFCDSNCVWTDHHPDCKLAQCTWVGLTDEERESIVKEYQSRLATALIIEAKLKEKNT